MRFLKMFFASLRMANALDNDFYKHDASHNEALIDELCPQDDMASCEATDTHSHTGIGAAAKPA